MGSKILRTPSFLPCFDPIFLLQILRCSGEGATVIYRYDSLEELLSADPVVREDDRDPGSNRPPPGDERSVAVNQGLVPHAHAGHVGDRVRRSGSAVTDADSQVPSSHWRRAPPFADRT